MAAFEPALSFLLDHEDRKREYAKVQDVSGWAIAGINSKAFPVAYIGISETPQDERAPLVAEFYRKQFWEPMNCGGLDSQDLANRLLDAGVNMGAGTAAKLLQKAVAALDDPGLVVDGKIGPLTVSGANLCDPRALLDKFRALRADHYRAIAVANPDLLRYLGAWLTRAEA